jgi:uncharacterized protein
MNKNFPYYNSYYFNSISGYLKNEFNHKIVKLSVDGGFTCPNRDGTLSTEGCIFCSEKGSGDFSGKNDISISDQILSQIALSKSKWSEAKYIVYFQNFTNTYGDLNKLKSLYYEALSYPDVIGLAIATRPDCISDDVYNLLSDLNKETFLWVELGLQTIQNETALLINRCYSLEVYENCIDRLTKLGIKTVVHLILGLPGESRDQILETSKFVSKQDVFGIKLQLLHILRGTALEPYFNAHPSEFHFLEFNDYINLVVDILELFPKETTIHRITGDGPKDLLIEPLWSLNKFKVINEINTEFRKRKSFQGINFYSCSNLPSL